ncbi:GNAT family N-acetyltransferase [Metabacillus idriensis]|uniref:GNAT family N-acetyltransferase n=1 Tax=Metabacillus idriensis TaxID=324768 RepID=UPI0028138057|nr:GNAT family N-acetyltransferase [Metabacillus idriensis]MDR0140123.1 GNAT family N-acetyltransferase [Metabacillus idriensis]
MNYKIRKAVIEDAKQIAVVHVDSWRTTYTGIVADAYLESLTYESREKRWQSIDPNSVFVAENDKGQLVGFAGFGPERTKEHGFDGELYAIYLLKEVQRTGIGRRLVKAVADELMQKNYQSMLLWVMNANPSKGFYERFSPEKIAEDVYTIEGTGHQETALGWRDLPKLSAALKRKEGSL